MNIEDKEKCLSELPNRLIEFIQTCHNTGNTNIELSDVEKYSILYIWFGINVKYALLKLSISANPVYKKIMTDYNQRDSWDQLIEIILDSEYKDQIFTLAFNDVCATIFLQMMEKINTED